MEVEEIQTQACNFSRIGNGINDSDMIGQKPGERYRDEDEDDTEGKVGEGSSCGGRSEDSPLQAWQSSRICRVSRASCGKDRHSKVYTAKGLRDRRVRLSVSTAIQFYDLQDRLGFDQPSKAVDWLINAASEAIAELPPLNCSFPDTLKQPNHEKPRFHSAEIEPEIEPTDQHHHISFAKSACSSASETSKGSAAAFSLSRNESRVKARERAKEKRVAKEKEKEKGKEKSHSQSRAVQQNVTPTSQSQTFSFTELLTREGIIANNKGNIATTSAQQNNGASSFVFRHSNHSTPSPMDYFNGGLFNQASSRIHHSSGFPSQSQFPSHSVDVMSDNQELQQFSFLPDHYNLNFPISSSLSGFNRGTLQSNSPSPLPHLQRLSSPLDGSNVPLFISRSVSPATTVENHQLSSGFETQLQHRYDDPKGKGRS